MFFSKGSFKREKGVLLPAEKSRVLVSRSHARRSPKAPTVGCCDGACDMRREETGAGGGGAGVAIRVLYDA